MLHELIWDMVGEDDDESSVFQNQKSKYGILTEISQIICINPHISRVTSISKGCPYQWVIFPERKQSHFNPLKKKNFSHWATVLNTNFCHEY